MHLTHKIVLDITCRQRQYFARAAGVHRFCWNWALAEWSRQYKAGDKPNGNVLRAQFNMIYPEQFPWVGEVHRDCHSQPFIDLQTAFRNFFAGRGQHPAFKKKDGNRPSFYVANDKMRVDGKRLCLPRIGWVRMTEELRFAGRILSTRVVEEAGRWFACITVDVGDLTRPCNGDACVGVDLGVKTLATLSTGEQIENPKPLRKAQHRLRRANRRLHRRVKGSKNRRKQKHAVARIHRRVRNIRHDVLHKLTTRLSRENQAVVIENLAPGNMVRNHRLALAISDAGFGMFRTLLTYKSQLYGTRIVMADRFFPSSKRCSACGLVKDRLLLGERTYRCECGLQIDRDLNAARNLVQLGAACAEVTPVERSWGLVEAGTKP